MEGRREWYSDYTLEEMNSIITNMLNYIAGYTDDCGNVADREALNVIIDIYTDFGFHKDEVESWYEWLDEQLHKKLDKNNT